MKPLMKPQPISNNKIFEEINPYLRFKPKSKSNLSRTLTISASKNFLKLVLDENEVFTQFCIEAVREHLEDLSRVMRKPEKLYQNRSEFIRNACISKLIFEKKKIEQEIKIERIVMKQYKILSGPNKDQTVEVPI